MKVIKKIVFPIFSIFLIYKSYELIGQLWFSDEIIFSVADALFISFLINLYITGIFAFIGFAYPTSKIMPDKFFRLSKPPRLKVIYRLMGVGYYRFMLLALFWGTKKNRQKYFNGTRKGLQNFIYQTRQSEFGHFCAFVLILLLSVTFFGLGYYFIALFTITINILGNLYPVVLQRYHRIRIEKLAIS